jgi:hypothetical protein
MTGAITTNSTFDGRDVATDGTKLDGIEASATADQTGAQIKTAYEAQTNAFTDAQFTKLGGIEASATADQTAAEIRALVESATDSNVFTDADHTKLNGVEASADVTDTANVTAAGALMDSELTAIASVKALNQGVATGDSPTFVDVTATSLDISGNIDVDGVTNLDVVDIDGAVDMAATLQVTGAANFSDRIGSTYVYPSFATAQTAGVANHFWKMGRMTLAGPAAAEIELHGLTGYGQNDPIAGKNIIQLRGSNSATVLDGTFHATGDPGIGIQEMRYVPIGSYVFDLYVKLGTFASLSTTVTCGGTWAPEWTNTGSGSNPSNSVDMPAHYALLLGNNIAMYADLSEVVWNDDSNDIDFRVESANLTHALFVQGSDGNVGVGDSSPSYPLEIANANSTSLAYQRTGVSAKKWGFTSDNAGTIWSNITDSVSAMTLTNAGAATFNSSVTSTGVYLNNASNGFLWNTANGGIQFGTNNTERMKIHGTGEVTKPYQPAFSVTVAAEQTNIAVGADVTVVWGTEIFDVGSNFASNTFTAPVTGKYQLSLNLRLDNVDSASAYYIVSFFSSNRAYRFIYDSTVFAADADFWATSLSLLADMDANDTVYVGVNQAGGTAQTDVDNDATYQSFTGYLAC